uniref:Uncharacterized protein n=1 Tax=Arundo donax TaxID=35708 RepID=A0A0A8ZRT4_ARUDO
MHSPNMIEVSLILLIIIIL